MLSIIRELLGVSTSKISLPQPQTILKDKIVSLKIDDVGYCIVDFLSDEKCQKLTDVFEKYHKAPDHNDGVFMGVISKKVHTDIKDVLHEELEFWFHNYKPVNAYVVKVPGQKSFVPIHQDVAAIDELKFSTLNVWIPLQDVTIDNGVMYVVPRSHYIFSPYRGANVDALSKNIETELRPYFKPLYLKKGQALFFDSRMFHFSPPNLSDSNRIITVCRIFPKEAKMISYYKDPSKDDGTIEIWQCQDDYLLNKNGYDDNARPPHAKLIGQKKVDTSPISREEFDKRRIKLGIETQPSAMPENEYYAILNQQFSVAFERP